MESAPMIFFRVLVGDQGLLVVDVGSEVAGVAEGRRGEDHVHFLRAGLAEDPDDAGGSRAAYDGVIHEDDSLVLHGGGDGVELDADACCTLGLFRLDEGPADVLVLDQADAVGNAAFVAVTQGGVEAESGAPMTTSASTGWDFASRRPARMRASWTETPSTTESGRAK